MHNYEVAHAARVTVLDADKFKRCRVSINFIWPCSRKAATATALLSFMMERGYADCPDMTELSKRLAKLYGASLAVDTGTNGANRVLSVSVTGIKDAYAIEGENLTRDYADLMFGVAFRPFLVDGVFDAQALDIEREKLRELLESEINEKRTYCIRQARRKFFGDAPEGVERLGYVEELDSITPADVTAAYHEMLRMAQVEVLVLGADDAVVRTALQNALAGLNRTPCPLPAFSAQPRQEEAAYTQAIDAVQGKLCLLFTCEKPVPKTEFSAVRVAVALFGGTPTSRLFMNVREKESLCYYCAAGYSQFTGMLMVDSGIEHKNAAKAKAAILRELNNVINGDIAEKELRETKASLINHLTAMEDNLSSLESWHFTELLAGTQHTPAEVASEINAVTAADIKKALQHFTLSVSYLLTSAENAAQ